MQIENYFVTIKRVKMKSLKFSSILVVLMWVMLDLAPSTIAAPANRQEADLFTDAVIEGTIDKLGDPTVVRDRFVDVKFDLLLKADQLPKDKAATADKLVLNLFQDVVLTALLDRVESNSPDSFSWIGHLEGVENSQVILVVGNGLMAGNITLPGAFYQVRYAGNGIHAVYEIDQSGFPPEAEPIPVDIPDGDVDDGEAMGDDGSIIDVLVVYTATARTAAGGTAAMNILIDLAVSETNTSYSNSGIDQRLRLVYREEVSYSEVNFNWSQTLSRLKNPSDGYMDYVHALRNTYCADTVVLLVANTSFCGLAYMMSPVSPSFESWAFALVSYTCATGYYSFGHELGHNMAARHDWYVDPANNSPFTYNHGYVYTPDRWRTVMAYNNACGDLGFNCTRLQYWSNPEVTYGGVPMGVPEGSYHAADNRKTLNNTAYTVANFRESFVKFEPDIKANGSDGPITITTSDPLSLTVVLDAGGSTNENADWWAVGDTPYGWYYYNLLSGWLPGLIVTYQGALFDLSPYEVMNMTLPSGFYTFYFGVDMNMNGSIDMGQLYYDSVDITVTP